MTGKIADKIKPAGETKTLLPMFITYYAIHCVEQTYFIYGNVMESYGYNPQTTGNALGIFFLAVMLTRPVGGWMIENIGIRRSMIFSGALSIAGCSLLTVTRNIYGIYAGRAISGFAFGVFTLGIFSYQALVTTPENRGKAIALTSTGGVLPTATVTLLGEWLLLGGRIKTYLALGPLFSVLSLFLAVWMAGGKADHSLDTRVWGTYRDLVGRKPFVIFAATTTMMALVDASVTSISLFAAEREIPASYFLTSFSIAALLSRVFGAKLINTLPRQFCVAPCGMLMAGALAAVSMTPSGASFIICGTIFGIGIGGGFPMLLASVSDILPPSLRPKGTAFILFLYDTAWGATPILVGYMTPYLGRPLSFVTLSVVTFAALAALAVFYWIPRLISERRAKSGESPAGR